MVLPSLKRAISADSSGLSSAQSDIEELTEVVETKITTEPKGTKRKRVRKAAITASVTQSTTNEPAEEIIQDQLPRKRGRQTRKNPVYTVDQDGESEDTIGPVNPSSRRAVRKKKSIKPEEEQDHLESLDEEEGLAHEKTKLTKLTKRKAKPAKDVDSDVPEEKPSRKRKTKEEKEAEAMPLAARTAIGSKMVIGAHVSSAGGLHNAVTNALHIGANAFALFLKSQRKWVNPCLDSSVAESFHSHCKKHEYDQNSHVVPHGSYLVNLAATDEQRTKQAFDSFLDDLKRCEKLGIKLYNFHPGNCLTSDRTEAIKHLASNLNRAHKETSTVVTLLENMAAGGNVLGSTFEDLKEIISHVEDKSRVGVCFDTCHAFAGGYDLRSKDVLDSTLADFEKTVGMEYLRALHLNDSKAPFQSHRDLHANIGTGFLGLQAFHAVMNEKRFWGLPGVLETPISAVDDDGAPVNDKGGKQVEDKGIWAREIKLLESLVGMDIDSEDFKAMDRDLQRKGAPERERVLAQVEKKEKKAEQVKAKAKTTLKRKGEPKAKVAAKSRARGKKTVESESESEQSDVDNPTSEDEGC